MAVKKKLQTLGSARERPNPTGFAQRVRELRAKKNLSQAELGHLVELHQIHIGRYERGESRPSADTLKKLADVLGVSADYLIAGTSQDIARETMEDRQLLQMFEEVNKLSREDRHVVLTLIDAFLAKRKMKEWGAEPALQ